MWRLERESVSKRVILSRPSSFPRPATAAQRGRPDAHRECRALFARAWERRERQGTSAEPRARSKVEVEVEVASVSYLALWPLAGRTPEHVGRVRRPIPGRHGPDLARLDDQVLGRGEQGRGRPIGVSRLRGGRAFGSRSLSRVPRRGGGGWAGGQPASSPTEGGGRAGGRARAGRVASRRRRGRRAGVH